MVLELAKAAKTRWTVRDWLKRKTKEMEGHCGKVSLYLTWHVAGSTSGTEVVLEFRHLRKLIAQEIHFVAVDVIVHIRSFAVCGSRLALPHILHPTPLFVYTLLIMTV